MTGFKSLISAWIFVVPAMLAVDNEVKAQCYPDIFGIHYQGSAACYISSHIENATNEVLAVGSVVQVNGGLGSDAWMTKISSRGKILWAKQYMLPAYNHGQFFSVVMTTDSTFLVSGRFSYLRKRVSDNQIEQLYSINVILHFDKFGNLIWMKSLDNYVTWFANINNILKVSATDYIINLNVYGANLQRSVLFRMDLNGNIKWATSFQPESMTASQSIMKLSADGSVLIGGLAFKGNSTWTEFTREGWSLLKFNTVSGSNIWSKGYFFSIDAEPRLFSARGINQIIDRNGQISFYSSYSDQQLIVPPAVEKGVAVTIHQNGNLVKAMSYRSNSADGTELLDASEYFTDGSQLLALDDGSRSIVSRISADGSVSWSKKYSGMNGNLKIASILKGTPSQRFLFRGRTQVALMGLLKTETNGDMSCMEENVAVISADATQDIHVENIPFSFQNEQLKFTEFGGGINQWNYNFRTTVDCEITCCMFTRSDTSLINLCDRQDYRLPDGSLARKTGLYYTYHRTVSNCDSLAYYAINFRYTPKPELGPDDCMNGRDTIILRVDSIHSNYNWMGTISNSYQYIVQQPGTYWVSISNQCGTGKDTITILEECFFQIFMPTGFTPNGDGLNDNFGVPLQNRNRFLSLNIYNRWGQLIFSSREIAKRWNGTLHGVPQPTGTYIYLLEMETLDGKPLRKSGTFNLLR